MTSELGKLSYFEKFDKISVTIIVDKLSYLHDFMLKIFENNENRPTRINITNESGKNLVQQKIAGFVMNRFKKKTK